MPRRSPSPITPNTFCTEGWPLTTPRTLDLFARCPGPPPPSVITGSLRKAIKSRADTVFVDGPFLIEAEALPFCGGVPEEPQLPTASRSWWRLGGDARYPSETAEYSGFEVAYEQLIGELRRNQPVDGVLGFSQGASSIGLLLTRMAASDRDRDLLQGLRFAVLVGGFLPKHPGWAGEIKAGMPPNREDWVWGSVAREHPPATFMQRFPSPCPTHPVSNPPATFMQRFPSPCPTHPVSNSRAGGAAVAAAAATAGPCPGRGGLTQPRASPPRRVGVRDRSRPVFFPPPPPGWPSSGIYVFAML